MTKLTLAAALALTVIASQAYAGDRVNDSSAEVNVSTPKMAYEDGYKGGLPPSTQTVRTTTTTYTTASRHSSQAPMGDEVIFRPYRTYSRTIETGSPVVSHSATVVTETTDPSLAADAAILLDDSNYMAEPYATDTVIIHE